MTLNNFYNNKSEYYSLTRKAQTNQTEDKMNHYCGSLIHEWNVWHENSLKSTMSYDVQTFVCYF